VARVKVTALGDGEYQVEHDDRQDIVFAVERDGTAWAFWNGHVFQDARAKEQLGQPATSPSAAHGPQRLTAPMPATVIKVLVTPGQRVAKGDTVVLLEAMKMELPVRALADGAVTAVNCREGDLVQPDQVLVEL
jgi:glutaconyl-CoA/methylmalonyl-CoA decarboxylase subunit gamma